MLKNSVAFPLVTYEGIRAMIMTREQLKKKQNNKPLEHLRLLNNQPRSISSITSNLPTNVHCRHC
ncbi:hypothetical protein RO3G_15959 [Rhizopus delemar RA 99-880]|uniref:Uncharacterized protein n=1 Tax=Rhizopus delemar (strain RA 99-880 / ATCC MYA-4621 / FGSC 9543 / NRRL 43880) TaxID=246409 RepID=I1CS18_RHIO9|nr:hypothetical protein RO3G_15959 [Rhizopus delemar RA 99-880]|eukprot:EIE91248.1 hypothetical protein RO3G_15959 [Rhizopus delemar RA 99-880]